MMPNMPFNQHCSIHNNRHHSNQLNSHYQCITYHQLLQLLLLHLYLVQCSAPPLHSRPPPTAQIQRLQDIWQHTHLTSRFQVVLHCAIPVVPVCLPLFNSIHIRTGHNRAWGPVVCMFHSSVQINLLPFVCVCAPPPGKV